MKAIKWVGPIPKNLAAFNFKKNVPDTFAHATKRRVDFGLQGVVYVLIWNGAVLTRDGQECQVHEACLHTPGWVIGMRDIQSAGNLPWAEEWRQSMYARIEERLGMHQEAA